MDQELPLPDTKELHDLVKGREERLIYKYLYERRDDPPTQAEIDQYVAETFGKAHPQSQRRRRNLKTEFGLDVRKEHVPGRGHVYRLVGFRPDFTPGARIDLATRAKVLHDYHERCAMCGRSPQEHGVVLHIDHKIPKDWGGHPTDEANLWPLCEYCNQGKKAHFAHFGTEGEAIAKAIRYDDPWTRIGELLVALDGQEVPEYLLFFVAREENQGDYKKRARELSYILGWDIDKRKDRDKVTRRSTTYYRLVESKPWPSDGARAEVNRYESARRKKKAEKDRFAEED